MGSRARFRKTAIATAFLFAASGSVAAHPHVMIGVETALVVEGGNVTGLRHRWTFDKAYLASIVEEYDTDRDRRIAGAELAKLVADTRSTLQHFAAFTVAWSGKRKLKLRSATHIKMTFEADVPVLQFSVDLTKPVPLAAEGLQFEVYDATYFSAFRFAGPSAVTFAGAPQPDCTLNIERAPSAEQRTAYRGFAREFGPAAAKLVNPTVVVADCTGTGNSAGQAATAAGVSKPLR